MPQSHLASHKGLTYKIYLLQYLRCRARATSRGTFTTLTVVLRAAKAITAKSEFAQINFDDICTKRTSGYCFDVVLAAAMDIQAIGSTEQLKPLQYAGIASHVISVSEALELRYREL